MRIQNILCVALLGLTLPDWALAQSAQSLFPETTARPLFSPDRRPYQPPVVVVAQPAPAAPEPVAIPVKATPVTPPLPTIAAADYTLKGVIQAGTVAIAMVQNAQTGAMVNLSPGKQDLVNGAGQTVEITVTDIRADTLTFKAGAQALTLRLRDVSDKASVELVRTADQKWAADTVPTVSQQVAVVKPAPLVPKSLSRQIRHQVGAPQK